MKKPVFLFSILILAYTYYSRSLGLGFISDDYYYLSINGFREAWVFKPNLYHYIPVFWTLIFALKTVFGSNPYFFHLASILIHTLNIFLVFITGRSLGLKSKTSLIASLIFAFFFGSFEVVFWITGMDTSLMVFFGLLSLLFFIKFTKNGKIPAFFLHLLFFVLSVLTHEYAFALISPFFFYIILFIQNNKKKKILLSLVLWILTGGITLLLKVLFITVPFLPAYPSAPRILMSFIKSLIYLSLPVVTILDLLPKVFLPFLFLLFLAIWYKKGTDRLSLFLFFWMVAYIVLFSITSLPQARYFYPAFVPGAILVARFLSNKLKIGGYPVVFIILISNILFLNKQLRYFYRADEIIQASAKLLKEQHLRGSDKLLFLNLPDSVNGPPWNVYVFRQGVAEMVDNFTINPGEIKFGRTVPFDEQIRNDAFLEKKDIEGLKNSGYTVFQYDEKERILKKI